MKNLVLSLLVCFPAMVFAQNCETSGLPPTGQCCETCSCLTCGAVAECENLPGNPSPETFCLDGGCSNCGTNHPTNGDCTSWTENYYNGPDEACVPIDGGLGFLIAGGLGMGVLGVRRRKELELEA
ncbi:hypothetical protein OAG26_00725 [Flavobacteriales bacterium]|nr:hypothetical protein [Flavobacteriales bacterium]